MTPEIKQRIDKICHGEVPEGYQRTFLGIAPKSWDKSRIDKICRLSSGSTPRRDAVENFAGDILWVTSGELKRRTIEDTREKISETAVVNSHLEIYDPGTVVIAIYGLEAAGIRGTVSIIGKQCTISQACMAFTEFKGIDNEFFYYWYLNNGQVIGLRYAQGTKQQNLSTDIVGSFPICFPSQGEQQKIAAILTTQDKVIELKEKRLAENQRQKKYLMQQLLTGKKRLPGFSEEWKIKPLKKLTEKQKKKNHGFQYRLVLSNSAQHGIVSQDQEFDKEIANEERIDGYYVVIPGAFVYNPRISVTAPCGPINVNETGETGIMSPLYTVFTISSPQISQDFLKYYFQSSCWYKYVKGVANYGARHDRISISDGDFFDMPIPLPTKEEQNYIAKVLSAADREIELLQQDIEQEKQKKKALMQLLLTGIVRVKT
jgi:type I restriction enzyme S subunit